MLMRSFFCGGAKRHARNPFGHLHGLYRIRYTPCSTIFVHHDRSCLELPRVTVPETKARGLPQLCVVTAGLPIMHTVWVRLNAVVFFGLSVLLGFSCLAALSKVGHSLKYKPGRFEQIDLLRRRFCSLMRSFRCRGIATEYVEIS